MKKTLLRIVFLTIILLLSIYLKSFAQGTFNFYAKEGLKVKPGETIEVPLYLDGIKLDGVEKNLLSFSGTIEYDINAFELIPYEDGSIVKVNEDVTSYEYEVRVGTQSMKKTIKSMDIKYNASTKRITASITDDAVDLIVKNENSGASNTYENFMDLYINKVIQVGTIQIKAKDNAESGNYVCKITDLKAENGEFEVESVEKETQIYIIPKDTGTKNTIEEDASNEERDVIINKEASKKAILKIEVSKDGKKITITPDEVNGAEISAITNKNKELDWDGEKFVFDSEPNMIYEFFIYGADGSCLGNEFVKTIIKEEDNKQEENKQEENKKEETPAKENEKKSPQTGDKIYIAVAILSLMLIAVIATTIIKKK